MQLGRSGRLLAWAKPLAAIAAIATLLCTPVSVAWAQGEQGQAASPQPAQDVYREVIAWGLGASQENVGAYIAQHSEELDELYDQIERSAYRHGIMPEFALAIVAAEGVYGQRISWARLDSWTIYEIKTGNQVIPPSVFSDLNNAISQLKEILNISVEEGGKMDDVFRYYWCGPRGDFNTESFEQYRVAVSKLWGALEYYAEERKRNENRNKYNPSYYNQQPSQSGYALLASGDLAGYSSSIGAMPELAGQLKSFGEDERLYAAWIQSINKSLSDAEAIVIARAILTYTEKTSHGDQTSFWVDPRLVMAVVRAESAFKPRAVSKVGALGLGQLMPATARSHGSKDPFDPVQNLYGCVKYLERERYRWRSSGNWLDLVLASYNAGAGAVQKYKGVPPYKETQSFVRIVKGYYSEFCGE